MSTLTENEKTVIAAMLTSDFGDGDGTPDGAVGETLWMFDVVDFLPKASRGGVVASLSKKGFVDVDDHEGKGREKDQLLILTQAGADAYKASVAGPASREAYLVTKGASELDKKGGDVDVFSFGKWYRGEVVKVGRTRRTVRYTTGGGKTREKAFPSERIRTHHFGAWDFTPS